MRVTSVFPCCPGDKLHEFVVCGCGVAVENRRMEKHRRLTCTNSTTRMHQAIRQHSNEQPSANLRHYRPSTFVISLDCAPLLEPEKPLPPRHITLATFGDFHATRTAPQQTTFRSLKQAKAAYQKFLEYRKWGRLVHTEKGYIVET